MMFVMFLDLLYSFAVHQQQGNHIFLFQVVYIVHHKQDPPTL